MKRIFIFLCLTGFLFFTVSAQQTGTLTLELQSIPASHPADSFYVAGSFNGWNPALEKFRFQKNEGKLILRVQLNPGDMAEFKITRGSWQKCESSSSGAAVSNRVLKFTNDTTIHIHVDGWADAAAVHPPVSTRSANVLVVDTAFRMPQLNRTRRIWVYLPSDYHQSAKKYPVLYMQDGQNLFDVLTAPYGEWGMDEFLDSVVDPRKCIIVGIDHGGNTRLTEYNPYDSRFGKGEGDAYVDFLVYTLKPYIDNAFRTKSGRKYTSVAGSSMGGLISYYAAVKHPEVFGSAGVFSPAFWIAPALQQFTDKATVKKSTAFYFVCGDMESKEMVGDMELMASKIRSKGARNVYTKVVIGGRHNEKMWQQEIPGFYNWLQRYMR